MKSRRKLNLQLTPLLDLLLIVFFAQYIELQTLTAKREQEVAVGQNKYQLEVADLQQKVNQSQEEIAGQKILLQMQLTELNQKSGKIKESENKLETTASKLNQLSDDRRILVQVLSRMFQINAEKLEKFLSNTDDAGAPQLSPETNRTLASLIPRLMKMSETAEEGLIRHVLEYDELRKHCDVWNIFVNDDSVIEFAAGEFKDAFNSVALTPEDFATKLFNTYKKLPETKGTVVILISYGDNPASIRQAVIKGMPLAVEKMRQDTSNRTRFEFAIIGFRPRIFKSPLENAAELENPAK
jgi:hypothetical protein